VVRAVRYGIPLAILVAGVVCLALAGGDGNVTALGVLLVGVAGLVVLLGAIVRAGERSNQERVEEERAREFYDAHGRWPE
jgi:hypothetical protein